MTENEKIAGDLLMSASSVFTPLDKDSIEKRQQRTKIEETISKKAEELENNESIKEYIKQGIENEKAIDLLVENSKVKKAAAKKADK